MTLESALIQEIAESDGPVAVRDLTAGTYGMDRYHAMRRLVEGGSLILTWDRYGNSYVELPVEVENQILCFTCEKPLDPDKGELFLTDDGQACCNDHYPDREKVATLIEATVRPLGPTPAEVAEGVRMWQAELDRDAPKIAELLEEDTPKIDGATAALGILRGTVEVKPSNPYRVGSIWYTSWGYDQTNVDFFEVVRESKGSVWVRRIASQAHGDSRVAPVRGAYMVDTLLQGNSTEYVDGEWLPAKRYTEDAERGYTEKMCRKGRSAEYPSLKIDQVRHAWPYDHDGLYETPAGMGH